jgi:hypothetical protein
MRLSSLDMSLVNAFPAAMPSATFSLVSHRVQALMQEYRDYHRTFMRSSLEVQRSAIQIETCRSIACCRRVHEELFGRFQMKWLHESLRE